MSNTNQANQVLDAYVQRFQNLPPWNIHLLAPNGTSAKPWYEVTGEAIARELIFDELNTMVQVDTVAADIQKWSRLEAMCLRVWQLTERELRTWKAKFSLEAVKPPVFDAEAGEYPEKEGWGTDSKGKPKAPTQATIEALYRTHKKYAQLSINMERAEEAYNATRMVTEAFKVKARLIERFARKYHSE